MINKCITIQCNIGEPYLKKLLQKMAEMLLENIASVINDFEEEYGAYPALERVKIGVTKRCKKMLKNFILH